jgi:pimeloyl-ACP methyl ester carboxylesterase
VGLAIVVAAVCAWGTLCLLFWQGSWQLLYHPTAAVARTPASVGLPFGAVAFDATEAGDPQLEGWWIPAALGARYSHITALYLHGPDGNLGDTVDALALLHEAGPNVLAFDYRGYGQSKFARPSEARWREDAESALLYLTATRHIAANSIVVVGRDLGANLALQVAAAHPELAGVVPQAPREQPANVYFRDPRARLVPAHALVRDRYDMNSPAAALRIPSLWFYWTPKLGPSAENDEPEILKMVTAPRMLIWLPTTSDEERCYQDALSRWLDGLPLPR